MELAFFKDPRATWDAMLDDCRKAAVSIEMEQYIVQGNIGNTFLEVFLQKLEEGISVRLLLDRVGSRSVFENELIQKIIAAGGQVRFYNPPRLTDLLTPARWFPRNHTKTLLIDSKIAYIGGVCLHDDMANWRDAQVRFTGPLVDQIEARFLKERINWRARVKKLTARKVAEVQESFEYVIHRPRLGPNPIYRQIVRAIRQSRTSVCLVTPYFLPPFGLRRAMRKAAKRGVKVSVMMSEVTDAPIADCVSHSYFPGLYRSGIRIFLYRKSVLHAKYAIIDDDWATIGSTNLDYLSLKYNREANIMIRDKAVVETLQSHFDDDLPFCIEVGKDYWHKLPLWHRALGYMGRIIKKML